MHMDKKGPGPSEYKEQPEPASFNETSPSRHPYTPLPIRSGPYRRPWYCQSWLWLVAALLAIAGIVAALWAVAGEINGVSRAVQEQTGALREQTGMLAAACDEPERMTASVNLNRVTDTIQEVVRDLPAKDMLQRGFDEFDGRRFGR